MSRKILREETEIQMKQAEKRENNQVKYDESSLSMHNEKMPYSLHALYQSHLTSVEFRVRF
ncbi:protein of unknown function [Shewanella benthica]|uniref:Uncharacterized protein n=1 Tax=Shewanella benthica TaxID=43661 RepID=A0A330M217_9GAMM|nr:protein of unknown function [Shewanella benthica]